MSKIPKVTIEYDDHIREIEGKEAEKFEKLIKAGKKQLGKSFIIWKIVEKHPQK